MLPSPLPRLGLKYKKWRRYDIFIVNFENSLHHALVILLLNLNRKIFAGKYGKTSQLLHTASTYYITISDFSRSTQDHKLWKINLGK